MYYTKVWSLYYGVLYSSLVYCANVWCIVLKFGVYTMFGALYSCLTHKGEFLIMSTQRVKFLNTIATHQDIYFRIMFIQLVKIPKFNIFKIFSHHARIFKHKMLS